MADRNLQLVPPGRESFGPTADITALTWVDSSLGGQDINGYVTADPAASPVDRSFEDSR